jgi:hypothetical protein
MLVGNNCRLSPCRPAWARVQTEDAPHLHQHGAIFTGFTQPSSVVVFAGHTTGVGCTAALWQGCLRDHTLSR